MTNLKKQLNCDMDIKVSDWKCQLLLRCFIAELISKFANLSLLLSEIG